MMGLWHKKLCAIFALILFACWAHAGQQFNKTLDAEKTLYSYQWQDHLGQTRNLQFTFDNKGAADQHSKTTRYQSELAKRYVFLALQKAALQVDPREASIQVQRLGKDIRVRVSSREPDNVQRWQTTMAKEEKSAYARYLKEHYYTVFRDAFGREGVKPDHLRYATESLQFMLPIAKAFYEQVQSNSDSREYVKLLLSWVQSIPYDKLQNRITSNGAGFYSPSALLDNNKGDCDSKSTLLIALLRSLLPKTSLALIYLPNHALVGVALPHRENEKTLMLNGTEFMLMEPTGPALLALGMIGANSRLAIDRGLFSYELMP